LPQAIDDKLILKSSYFAMYQEDVLFT